MTRIGCFLLLLIATVAAQGFDVQATIKRVDVENARVTFSAPDGRDRTAKVSPDAKLLDSAGKELTGGG